MYRGTTLLLVRRLAADGWVRAAAGAPMVARSRPATAASRPWHPPRRAGSVLPAGPAARMLWAC